MLYVVFSLRVIRFFISFLEGFIPENENLSLFFSLFNEIVFRRSRKEFLVFIAIAFDVAINLH